MVSRTIADLIPGVIATAHDNPFAAKLKGERRMSKAIANAVAARERVPASLPSIRINGFAVPIVRADIEQAITDAKRTRQQHNKARETFVHSMLIAMRNRYVDKLDYEPEQAELTDVMQQLRMNDTLRKTLNLAWLPMTGEWLIDQLFCKPQQLRRFAPWLEERDIEALVRPKGSPFTVSDIPLLDEAMELLGPDPKAVARQRRWTPSAPRRSSSRKIRWLKLASAPASSLRRCWSTISTGWTRNSPRSAPPQTVNGHMGISLSMKLRNSPPWIGACSSAVARRVRSPLWAMLRKPPHWAAPVRGGV